MPKFTETTIRGPLGIIRFDRPPVNALGYQLRGEILKAHQVLDADPGVRAIVLTGHGKVFSAGADITEFDRGRRKPYLNDLIAGIEEGATPVIALLNGVTYGGGLELALGCDYRVALPAAKLAFPEIKLGNIPGAGGTQKLPRLIGGAKALELILSGRAVAAEEAHRLGIVDAVDADLEAALDRLFAEVEQGMPRRRARDQVVPGTPEDLDAVAAPFLSRARGAPATSKAIEAVRMAYGIPIDVGLAWERETFATLNTSPEAKAQRHVFFAERAARKVAGIPPTTPTRSIERAGVVGAGTMGTGIAMCFADAGLPVTIVEQDAARLESALAGIRETYAKQAERGRISAETAGSRSDLVSGGTDLAELAEADIVVEAVFEALDLKTRMFARLDAVCKPGAILATNTSTLDVDRIAQATARPGDVIGLHFFSPAHIMKLLEVVRAECTAPDVVRTAMELAQRLGKVPVCVGICDGFAGNRMFINFNREAQMLVEDGALPWQVDRVFTEWGLAMGPFAVMDLAGLDVGYRIRKAREASRRPGDPYPFTSADRLAEAGHLGQKTGRGWYRYPDGARRGVPDPEVEALIRAVSAEKGIVRRTVSDTEILHRGLWQLVNTGGHLLDEGIAARASDLDVIFVNGYGFPKTRGGPMFYAQEAGLAQVVADIERYHAEVGDHWRPARFLKNAVAAGGSIDGD